MSVYGTKITLEKLAAQIASVKPGQRILVALAGPPASGKSHSARALASEIETLGRSAAVFQMDGFHYDDAVLRELDLLSRKGAPQTFDVQGFHALLGRLADGREPQVFVPVFDRDLELSRQAAHSIPRDVEVIIVEGNYLLLKDRKWADAACLYDITVMVEADEKTLRERLIERWEKAGLPADVGQKKVDHNDLPNGRLVIEESRPADFYLATDDRA